jgi:hypothetical protein
MPKYNFYIDQKETIWKRLHCSIEASDEKEAMLKMRRLAFETDYDIYCNESEMMFETSEDMTYEENLNNPTREIYYNDEMIKDNTPLTIKRDNKINKILNDSNPKYK